jgi:alcohol-forming fatty acyl-CoA reductase
MGAAKGVIRSMLLDGNLNAELIPVDTAINATILIAKQIVSNSEKSKEVEVFNITMDESKRRPMKYILEKAKKLNFDNPAEIGLWYPDGNITTNKFVHQLNVFFFHWIPAYFIDFLMFLFMQKRL